ncbi:MAG: hypothetical protein M3211_03580 [Actinomycetota bacterium]|nr:hypothetical protein [Actinomycetota bacterium]
MWSGDRAAARAAAAAGSALLVLSAAACTGEPEAQRQGTPPTPSPTATGSAPALRERAAPYDIGFRRIAGSLPRRRSQDILRGVTRPVRVWVERGFVDGPWPRERFRPAFGPFTSELARRARREAELLTLQRQGPELTSVVPQRRRVAVSATARGGHPVGATAHVDLRFLTVDRQDDRRRIRVDGDLYLTRTKTGWQIFGYDLDRRVEGPPGSRRSGAASHGSQGGDV